MKLRKTNILQTGQWERAQDRTAEDSLSDKAAREIFVQRIDK